MTIRLQMTGEKIKFLGLHITPRIPLLPSWLVVTFQSPLSKYYKPRCGAKHPQIQENYSYFSDAHKMESPRFHHSSLLHSFVSFSSFLFEASAMLREKRNGGVWGQWEANGGVGGSGRLLATCCRYYTLLVGQAWPCSLGALNSKIPRERGSG